MFLMFVLVFLLYLWDDDTKTKKHTLQNKLFPLMCFWCFFVCWDVFGSVSCGMLLGLAGPGRGTLAALGAGGLAGVLGARLAGWVSGQPCGRLAYWPADWPAGLPVGGNLD